jgi:hypothetical protein
MDGNRIRVQAAALAHKRAREVARARPELAAALGASFVPVFRGYARLGPKPASGGAAADAKAFARYLRHALRGLPPEARRAASRALRRHRLRARLP